jgi:Protein of unknown function (DUF2846)
MNTNEGGRGARSSWRLYAAFAVAAVLAGCATQSGPPLSSLATVGGPPKGMARVVVLRQEPHSFGPRNRNYPVNLDGEPLGELSAGSFAYLDRPAGRHQLSADLWGWPGVTRLDFTAVPGRTYYFRASLNEKMDDITGFSMISPLGGAIASVATYNDRQGPINLAPISESDARQAIAATR